MRAPEEVSKEGFPDGINSGLRLTGATSGRLTEASSGIDRPENLSTSAAAQRDRTSSSTDSINYTLTAETYRATNTGLSKQVSLSSANAENAAEPNRPRPSESRTSWNLRQNDIGTGELRDILAELELNLHRLLSSKDEDHQTSNSKVWTRCKKLIAENNRLRTLLKDVGADGQGHGTDKEVLFTAFYAWSTKALLHNSSDTRTRKQCSQSSFLEEPQIGKRSSQKRSSGRSFGAVSADPNGTPMLKVRAGSTQAIREVEASSEKKYELLQLWKDIAEGRHQNRSSQIGAMALRASNSRMSEVQPRRASTSIQRGDVVEKLSLESLSNKFRVNPISPRRMTWEALGMAFIIYDLVTVPFGAFDPPWKQLNIIMLCITSTYWTFDIASSFFVGFHIKGGLETRWRELAKKYVRTWFAPDVFLVGIDWILLAMELDQEANENFSYMKAGRGLRIMRFLRLLRLLKLSVYFDKIFEGSASEYVLTFMRVTKVILFILMSCHLIACAWYGVGNGLVSPDEGWVIDKFKMDDSIGYRYTTSLHWSLTQFTPASMEVVPTNTVERCLNVCVVIVAMVMFSTFISSITEAMTYLRKINSKKSEQFNELRTYLAENDVGVELASRVWRYLEQSAKTRQKRLVYQDVGLLKDLPEVYSAELHQEIYSPVITRHSFFAQYCEWNHLGVRAICQRATVEIGLARGQYLFSLGEAGNKMFFVSDGIMEYSQEDLPDTSTVTRAYPNWISEACLWLQWIHHGNMVSKVESVLYVLDAGKVHSILQMFTDVLPHVVEYAALFFQMCNKDEHRDKVSDVWIDADELMDIAQRSFEPEMGGNYSGSYSSIMSGVGKQSTLNSASNAFKGFWGRFLDKVGNKKVSPPSGTLASASEDVNVP